MLTCYKYTKIYSIIILMLPIKLAYMLTCFDMYIIRYVCIYIYKV